MSSAMGSIVMGVFILILGVANMRGNISTIHWYHRQRVAEEDIIPFGKKVGLGTIIIGVSMIVFGILALVTELTNNDFFVSIGGIIVGVGIVVGLAISLYAMIKYNKGIF